MRVVFWGARGSIAVSGPEFREFGGHTTCLELSLGEHRLIIDGGTGIRPLGEEIGFAPSDVNILFTHAHWDHIQGIPFFTPGFNPNNELSLFGVRREGIGIRDVLSLQMTPPTFPITLDMMPGFKRFIDIELDKSFNIGPFSVTPIDQNHPDGVVAYHVEAGGKRVLFATDVEHGGEGLDERLIEAARGADLVIHDAQYTEEEYRGARGVPRKGWGHSMWTEAVELGHLAGAKQLALFHHDPSRNDEGMREIERAAQALFPRCFAVREKQEVIL